jgi:DNA modification methylase
MPLALAEDHVKSWSSEGEVVFDPISGSGQVCLAAKRLGRRWLGFDVSAEYVELATKRLAAI